MKRIKHLLPLLLAIALVVPFFAFAGEKVPVVGILQYVQHGALDAAGRISEGPGGGGLCARRIRHH